jgi:hypothetical protein
MFYGQMSPQVKCRLSGHPVEQPYINNNVRFVVYREDIEDPSANRFAYAEFFSGE